MDTTAGGRKLFGHSCDGSLLLVVASSVLMFSVPGVGAILVMTSVPVLGTED